MPATVVGISQETPTVKTVHTAVVDFFIPGLATVVCSTPAQLDAQGTVELAIKRSHQAPAAWLHKARVGNSVSVAAGGTFTYRPANERRPLLLVAGTSARRQHQPKAELQEVENHEDMGGHPPAASNAATPKP
ncbi:oxidoreductase NAD-binding domain-containing 1 [Micractinium conductrix]|uniref:Oxidoreductase NAD-binding domain-containing 1 n=1 Tax=Micractinium conductrix TaxID=554055 RepID=A0A2P6VRX5_9CHLO|nr:oxidoreductase NAD-binding domain-containing 1 [Micractinium conductrix]|eukprot:PSC76832.1 oxidoreductase NAD-binding domain-containing 1 [Micractinium conductrix]